jgi:uncharacterized membrane protein
MPQIECNIWINAPLQEVYDLARKTENYPAFMEDVDSVEVLEQEGARVVTAWVGTVPTFGIKVRWTQEEIWDESQYTATFHQLKGDYDTLEGLWTFREEKGGTQVECRMDYEYHIPSLGGLFKKVIHNLVVKSIQSMFEALKVKAEQQHVAPKK